MEIQKSAFQLAMQQLHYDREAYKLWKSGYEGWQRTKVHEQQIYKKKVHDESAKAVSTWMEKSVTAPGLSSVCCFVERLQHHDKFLY